MARAVPAPLQAGLVAKPLVEPASVAAGLDTQTVWFAPALTVAGGLIAKVTVEVAGVHCPIGLFAVSVTVALPAVLSVTLKV